MKKSINNTRQEYTLVVGLGVTGSSVVRYLHERGDTLKVVDSRPSPPGLELIRKQFSNVECVTGGFDETLFLQAKQIIVSPGVSLGEPALVAAVKHGVPLCGDIDLFSRAVFTSQRPNQGVTKIVAVTGSNGKSTVTSLLADMARAGGLKVREGGNLGTPALDLIADNVDLYVLELSSFQLDTTHDLKTDVSVILNISEDHQDRYDSMSEYISSKQRIHQNSARAVVNLDDNLSVSCSSNHSSTTGYTLSAPDPGEMGLRLCATENNSQQCICHGDEMLLPVSDLKIRGQFNVSNALAALSLANAIGLAMPAAVEALKKFPGLPHRMQWIAESNGVNWFNDSKATNVGASLAAIQGLPGKHVLIAGGQAKGADFTALAEIAREKLRVVILIGRDAAVIQSALKGSVPVTMSPDMDAAVALASMQARSGDNVLLSPACASFDMYRDFAHRGEVFVRAVHEALS